MSHLISCFFPWMKYNWPWQTWQWLSNHWASFLPSPTRRSPLWLWPWHRGVEDSQTENNLLCLFWKLWSVLYVGRVRTVAVVGKGLYHDSGSWTCWNRILGTLLIRPYRLTSMEARYAESTTACGKLLKVDMFPIICRLPDSTLDKK